MCNASVKPAAKSPAESVGSLARRESQPSRNRAWALHDLTAGKGTTEEEAVIGHPPVVQNRVRRRPTHRVRPQLDRDSRTASRANRESRSRHPRRAPAQRGAWGIERTAHGRLVSMRPRGLGGPVSTATPSALVPTAKHCRRTPRPRLRSKGPKSGARLDFYPLQSIVFAS